jgi:hypothetical protein
MHLRRHQSLAMSVDVNSKSSIHRTQSSNTVVDQRTCSIDSHLRGHDFVATVSDNRTVTDTSPGWRVNAITITKSKTQHKIITCRKEKIDVEDFDLGELTDDV